MAFTDRVRARVRRVERCPRTTLPAADCHPQTDTPSGGGAVGEV